MTKGEIQTIRNIVARLKKERCGCAAPMNAKNERLAHDYEAVSRLYIDTWLISPLERLLPGDNRDVALAERMSGR